MSFDDTIIKQLDESLQLQREKEIRLKRRNYIYFLALGGLTIALLIFSIGLLLAHKELTHEYTFIGCELSCARAYSDIHYSSSGYFPTDEGLKCSCYDMRIPPQRKTPPVGILNFT